MGKQKIKWGGKEYENIFYEYLFSKRLEESDAVKAWRESQKVHPSSGKSIHEMIKNNRKSRNWFSL